VKKRPRLRLVGKEDAGTRATDIFDDMDKLRAEGSVPTETPELRPAHKPVIFAQVPFDRGFKLYRHNSIGDAGWMVLLELDYMVLTRHKNPLLLWKPEHLPKLKIEGHTRIEALKRLEAAKMVRIEWRGTGRAPLVTVLWRRRLKRGKLAP
jgi:hypothetical protein